MLTIFDYLYPPYKITKKVRLIELFAGIGAQYKGLKRAGIECESYKICEWAYNSILGYNAIHIKDFTDYSKDLTKDDLIAYLDGNISADYNKPANIKKWNEEKLRKCYNSCIATHNLMNISKVKGKDLEIVDTDKYDYIMTYSFPCQDLSNAGNRAGLKDTSTRSGLLWEVERLLKEREREQQALPNILLMENVPDLLSKNFVKDFNRWCESLESLGYKNYFQVLNAKDYEIPQNRKRVFMVSLLGEYSYEFPNKKKLKLKLKDMLESNVDEKYYLSEKVLSNMQNWNSFRNPLEEVLGKNSISPALTTRSAISEVGGINAMSIILNDDLEDKTNFLKIKENTKKGYAIGNVGDGVNISSRMEKQRGNIQKKLYSNIKDTNGSGCDS